MTHGKRTHLLVNDFLHFLFWQDVDTGYLGKMKLEAELSIVRHDLDFLKALYEEVHVHFRYFQKHAFCG